MAGPGQIYLGGLPLEMIIMSWKLELNHAQEVHSRSMIYSPKILFIIDVVQMNGSCVIQRVIDCSVYIAYSKLI